MNRQVGMENIILNRYIREVRGREAGQHPYWAISALECHDERTGAGCSGILESSPLRSFSERSAYIIAPALSADSYNERTNWFTLGGGEVVQRGAHPEPSATNTIPPFTPTPPHHLSASSTRLNASKQQLHKHSTAFTFIHQGRTVTDLSISIWGAWCKKLVGCRQTFWTSRTKQMPNLHTRQPRALCKWLEEAFVYFQNFTPGNNKPKKCTE